jgi:FKBP12-rapamycin complex-associated protein
VARGQSALSSISLGSIRWLLPRAQGDRSEQRRYAAVLVLKEVAENAPTSFNVHVGAFLDRIWVALRDPKVRLRAQ